MLDAAVARAERDDLRGQVVSRISERDSLQGRCDRLRKGLQNLLTQDDAPLPSPSGPTTVGPNTTGANAVTKVKFSKDRSLRKIVNYLAYEQD